MNGSARTIGLVARRDIEARVRSKAFVILTALLVVAGVVAWRVIPSGRRNVAGGRAGL